MILRLALILLASVLLWDYWQFTRQPKPTMNDEALPPPPLLAPQAVAVQPISLPSPPPAPSAQPKPSTAKVAAKAVAAKSPSKTAAVKPSPTQQAELQPVTAAKMRSVQASTAPSNIQQVKPAVVDRAELSTHKVSTADQKQGAMLLRMNEAGAGPDIQINWPDSARQRQKLFDLLYRCVGIQVAKYDGQRGVISQHSLHPSDYSALIRLSQGRLSPAEQQLLAKIPGSGQAIRLFPRGFDQRLLGGLHALVGDKLQRASSINGHYVLTPQRLVIEKITVDGKAVSGRLQLINLQGWQCNKA